MRADQRRKDTSRAWEPKKFRELDQTSYEEVTRSNSYLLSFVWEDLAGGGVVGKETVFICGRIRHMVQTSFLVQ